jgi:hypothetical protein
VGRVVFCENTEQGKWLRLESLLQDIAAHQPSDPSIVPEPPAIDPPNSASDRSGVVAPSSRQDIFQSGTAATASSSQGGRMAACHEDAFIDPGIADLGADDAPDAGEDLSISAAFAR